MELFTTDSAALRLELIPLGSFGAALAAVPPSCTVSITCPPRGVDYMLDAVDEATRRGFGVVPHLAARRIKSHAALERVVARLDKSGIDRVFVVSGDGLSDGPFDSSLALLEALSAIRSPFTSIGVAGYPEGHPSGTATDLLATLVQKQKFADHIVTQMCFSTRPIARWLSSLKSAGVTMPVHIGIPGVLNPAKLLAISTKIGVGASANYLKRHRQLALRLLGHGFDAQGLYAAMRSLAEDPQVHPIAGIQIFTFNNVEPTVGWLRQVQRSAKRDREGMETE